MKEMTKETCTVVEVAVKLKSGCKDNFENALSYQLEEMGAGGCENTEKIEQINTFESDSKDADWFLNFIGPSHDFEGVEKAVVSFLEEFKNDLSSDGYTEDWVEALDSQKIPQIDSFEIIISRPYNY